MRQRFAEETRDAAKLRLQSKYRALLVVAQDILKHVPVDTREPGVDRLQTVKRKGVKLGRPETSSGSRSNLGQPKVQRVPHIKVTGDKSRKKKVSLMDRIKVMVAKGFGK